MFIKLMPGKGNIINRNEEIAEFRKFFPQIFSQSFADAYFTSVLKIESLHPLAILNTMRKDKKFCGLTPSGNHFETEPVSRLK